MWYLILSVTIVYFVFKISRPRKIDTTDWPARFVTANEFQYALKLHGLTRDDVLVLPEHFDRELGPRNVQYKFTKNRVCNGEEGTPDFTMHLPLGVVVYLRDDLFRRYRYVNSKRRAARA